MTSIPYTDLRLDAISGHPTDAWGGGLVALSANVSSAGERAADGRTLVRFYDGDPA